MMYFRRQSQRPCHPGGSALTLWPARNRKNVRKCPKMSRFLKKTALRPGIAARQSRPSETAEIKTRLPWLPAGNSSFLHNSSDIITESRGLRRLLEETDDTSRRTDRRGHRRHNRRAGFSAPSFAGGQRLQQRYRRGGGAGCRPDCRAAVDVAVRQNPVVRGRNGGVVRRSAGCRAGRETRSWSGWRPTPFP